MIQNLEDFDMTKELMTEAGMEDIALIQSLSDCESDDWDDANLFGDDY